MLEGLDAEMRARVLQFVTGTSRVPVTGFRDLRVGDFAPIALLLFGDNNTNREGGGRWKG